MNTLRPEVWRLAGRDTGDLLDQLRTRRALWAEQTDGARSGDGTVGGEPTGGAMRLAIADPGARSLDLAERVLENGSRWAGRGGVWFAPVPLVSDGRLALVFPGVEPEFVTWPLDLEALSASVGLSAPRLGASTLSEHAASVVRLGIHLWQILDELGLEADEVAGHSIGEWTAAVAAGLADPAGADMVLESLDLELIQRRLPRVDYVATNGSADVVERALVGLDDVFVSHDNCPRQSMICGPVDRLDTALALLKEVGVRGARLNVRSGFHTPLLEHAVPFVRSIVDTVPFASRRMKTWSGTLGGLLPDDLDSVRGVFARQIVEPVRFAPMVRAMYDDGVRCFLQLGVGSTTGFIEDNLGADPHLAVSLVERGRTVLEQTDRAVAALWVDGVEVPHVDLLGSLAVAV